MASMKTMMMCVVDAGTSMGEFLEPAKCAKIGLGLSFINTYIVQRMMASKTVEFGVVTYGNDKTRNFLNQSQGGYEGVVEDVEMGRPTVTDLETIKNIKVGTNKGDIIDGIVTGQDVLIRVNKGKAFNRIMLIVTDGETEVEGLDDLETIVSQMKNIVNFGLYVAMIGKVDNTSTVIKKENAKLLASIAESTQGRFLEVDNVADSIHLLSCGLGLGTKPQVSKSILEINENLKIPVAYWGRIMKANVPTLKKKAKSAMNGGGGCGGDEGEEGGAGAVKRDTTYRNPEDPDQELNVDEKVKGFKYGSQYVPITPAEEEQFKIQGSPGIKLLGFIPFDSVPRHHFIELPMILQGQADSDVGQLAIAALTQAMKQTGLVALARFVKRENGDPFLACLMPTDDQEHSLLIHRLPCCEDIREYSFPSLISFASQALINKDATLKKQQTAMAAFIDASTVKNVTTQTMTPINFVLAEVYTEIYRRLCNIPVADTIHAGDPLAHSLTEVSKLEGINEAFPLVKNETTTAGKRKVYWSELDIKASDEVANGDGKAPRYELNLSAKDNSTQGGPVSIAATAPAAVEIPVFTVGSVTPVEDFQAVLLAAPQCGIGAIEIIRQAMHTMCDVIDRNVTYGASNAHYKRAVSCIQALRLCAVAEGEHALFNTYMIDRVKGRFSTGRHRAVWQLLQEENCTLISSTEDSGSSVSVQEAKDFLNEEKVAAPTTSAAPLVEEEDMFGNME